jgi:hypothetical protein
MPQGAALGGFLCAMVVGVVIGTLFGAFFLLAAISLYNKLAGGGSSSKKVPEPTLGGAMKITFATSLVQMLVGFLIGLVTGAGAGAVGAGGKGVDIIAQLISFPVSLLVMAAMLSMLLPTTFARGILLTLCYMLVVVFVIGILLAIAFALYGFGLKRA